MSPEEGHWGSPTGPWFTRQERKKKKEKEKKERKNQEEGGLNWIKKRIFDFFF